MENLLMEKRKVMVHLPGKTDTDIKDIIWMEYSQEVEK